MNKIQEAISRMSEEEMKTRLEAYMKADKEWMPKPVAIEVRRNNDNLGVGINIYDVVFVMDDDTEKVVNFGDRFSKLFYIYTLMHPQGYRRMDLNDPEHNYRDLVGLFRALYLISTDKLIESINKVGFEHFMSQAVTQSRRFIRESIGLKEFEIAYPRQHKDRYIIPAVNDELKVIMPPTLQDI
jgi:hypothetical protein